MGGSPQRTPSKDGMGQRRPLGWEAGVGLAEPRVPCRADTLTTRSVFILFVKLKTHPAEAQPGTRRGRWWRSGLPEVSSSLPCRWGDKPLPGPGSESVVKPKPATQWEER